MGKTRARKRSQEGIANGLTQQDWLDKLLGLALGTSIYHNLPKEIDARYLVKELLMRGRVCFFKEPVIGDYHVMEFTTADNLDEYGNPTRVNVFNRWTGYNAFLDSDQFVIIWDNLERIPLFPYLERASYRLYNLDMSIDVNCSVQRTTGMIVTPESKLLSVKNAMMNVDMGEPYMLVGNDFPVDSFQSLDFKAPFVAKDLLDVEESIYNQTLGRLGIQNTSVIKKERMLQQEVDQLSLFALANRRSRTQAQEQAIAKINDKFGLNIKYEFYLGLQEEEKTEEKSLEEQTNDLQKKSGNLRW